MKLIEDDQAPIENLSWNIIEEVLDRLKPGTLVTLLRDDGSQLKAMGAKLRFSIYYQSASSDKVLIVGRHPGQKKRGYPTVNGQYVLITQLEYWSVNDGKAVFQAFYKNQQLEPDFVLRDFSIPWDNSEIIGLLGLG